MSQNNKKIEIQLFRSMIWDYYRQFGRQFAWRNNDNPYHIVISEVMLQQTQTFRVEHKFEEFIAALPDFESLAAAELHDVLRVWQGLGYNRRGKMLHQLAQTIVQQHNGILPPDPAILETLPGIGKATASSICAFAFNMPTIFIETNIRTVFIAHFFKDQHEVHDREILPLVQQTVDQNNPREWYYALMDYGVFLKKKTNNRIAKQSRHYAKQSRFEGSDRQIRGALLRVLLNEKNMPLSSILTALNKDTERCSRILEQLVKEGLVKEVDGIYSIS